MFNLGSGPGANLGHAGMVTSPENAWCPSGTNNSLNIELQLTPNMAEPQAVHPNPICEVAQ